MLPRIVGGTALGCSAALYYYQQHNNVAYTAKKTEPTSPAEKIALNPNEFRSFRLSKTEHVSHNTTKHRFELPTAEHETGLNVASCVLLRAEIDGKTITRPYTPVSQNGQKGYVDLIIKSYPKPGGIMSRHIQSLRPGVDVVEMKGPFKKIEYRANMYKKMGMIAGGTGITPMLQIIREVLSNPDDRTQVSLVFANISEEDILLRDELDALAYLYPNFRVYYTLDKPPKNWSQGKGFVSLDMMKQLMPKPEEDAMILVCGPKGMIEHVAGPKGPKDTQGPLEGLLRLGGYMQEQVYKF